MQKEMWNLHLYSFTYSFIPLLLDERYVVMILCGYSLVRCYNGRKCVNMFTRPPPIRVARAHKVPMFNVWINLDHFQAHPTPPVSKKGTIISLVGHRNNINEPHSIMKLLWSKKPKSSANWHKYLLKESWMTFHKNYLAFCALSLCLALAAATSGPKLSHKVGNRDQIKTAASNLSAPAEPEPPEYIFRSVAQYFIFPRTFPCLWTWTSQFCERCGPRS